jgi:hypothetical protein
MEPGCTTGHPIEQVIGQPVFRVFISLETKTGGWSQTYRKARLEGAATHKTV